MGDYLGINMQMNLRTIRVIIVLLMLMLVSSVSYAQQYYKWVDQDGVTHYGEVLPDANIEHVAFEFPEQYTTANAADDYYSIQNQLQRMLEWRQLQRETRAQRQSTVGAQAPQLVGYEEPRYAVGSSYYPIYFPHLQNKYKYGKGYKNGKRYKYGKDYKYGKKYKHACKYGRNCYSPAPTYRKALFHNRKPASMSKSSGRSSKRGIHSGIAARAR